MAGIEAISGRSGGASDSQASDEMFQRKAAQLKKHAEQNMQLTDLEQAVKVSERKG